MAWTDPQVASTGLSEVEARRRARRIRVLRWPYAATDRAQIERDGRPCETRRHLAAGCILWRGDRRTGAGELINLYTPSICKGMYASDLAPRSCPIRPFSFERRGRPRSLSKPAGLQRRGGFCALAPIDIGDFDERLRNASQRRKPDSLGALQSERGCGAPRRR
ncbi:hypothetical protein [Methylocella tundrae]|uniref:hypothetical protein n=1 Tax=Methylocella tundrae TaxID=227605 RepID=UPI00141A8B22